MSTKLGFSGLNKDVNSSTDSGRGKQKENKPAIFNGRVIEVFLSPTDPNLVGCIQYTPTKNTPADISTVTNKQFSIARPLFPHITKVPLINEIVTLIYQPGKNLKAKSSDDVVYYITGVKVYNHPHHNSIPFREGNLQPSQQKSIEQTVLGSPLVNTPQSTEIYFGETFKERDTINPLLPFEGDVIYEGRWGNSIRFGSTVQNKSNNWSTTGTDGDPILILRNGQLVDATTEGWKPIVEDINKDISSLYLTSTQKIPIKVSSNNYKSYSSFTPTAPDQFSDKQIILSSGRLLFNSNKDHILLSSALTIGFNAIKGFNFDTNANFVVNSPSIQLGGKDAVEPLLLGRTTIDLLSGLVTQLSNLCEALKTVPTPYGPAVAPAATQLITYLSKLKIELETTTQSKISKTL